MRPGAIAVVVLSSIGGLLGIAAALRALIMAWYVMGYGFSTDPLRVSHSILNLIALVAVTATLFAGAALSSRRNPRGRTLVIVGCAAVIGLSLIEFAIWVGRDFLVWTDQGALGVTRWVWFGVSIITLVVLALAGTETRSVADDPEGVELGGSRAPTLLVAVLAMAIAAYHLWQAKRQFDSSLLYIADLTDLLPTTPSATWALAMIEPLMVSASAAAVLVVGAVLLFLGVAAGSYVVIAGCIITVAQAIFGWTDLGRVFYEIGAADLLTIFAPRTASVVVLTLTVPVVTAVLAAAARTRTPRT